jgi:hypothetical protein
MKMLIALFGAAVGVAVTISVGAGVAAAAPDKPGRPSGVDLPGRRLM